MSHLAQTVNKDHDARVAMHVFRQAEHKIHTYGIQHPVRTGKLARNRADNLIFESLNSFLPRACSRATQEASDAYADRSWPSMGDDNVVT